MLGIQHRRKFDDRKIYQGNHSKQNAMKQFKNEQDVVTGNKKKSSNHSCRTTAVVNFEILKLDQREIISGIKKSQTLIFDFILYKQAVV